MEIGDESKQSTIESAGENSRMESCETTPRSDNGAKRQMKNTDSGVFDDKAENSCDESSKRKKMNGGEPTKGEGDFLNQPQSSQSCQVGSADGKGDGFPKVNSKFKNRNYRSRSQGGSSADKASSDDETAKEEPSQEIPGPNQSASASGLPKPSSSNVPANEDEPMGDDDSWGSDMCKIIKNNTTHKAADEVSFSSTSCDSSSSDSSTSAMEDSKFDTVDSDREEPPGVLLKQKPKHKWFMTPEIINRQMGFSNRKQGSELFQQRMYGSLHSVQRLELMYKLEFHTGCVNSLHFNQSGTILASGSDDLQVGLWDWPLGKLLTAFDTGHKSNVFQAKFMPLSGDTHMVTCARDGQVRLVELASNGQLQATRKLAQHRKPAHKIATQNETPHVVLSSGEDARVMSLDIRQSKPAKVIFVKEGAKKISLYSIHSNPLNNNEFVVCGRDNYLRLYDQRNTSSPKSRFCPQHLNVKEPFPHVTCAVFNYNGTEIVATYNDEDIYLFDTRHTEGCDYVHRYQGHRNSATVKGKYLPKGIRLRMLTLVEGVNFFGPKSEFIVSGSDCGNIFFWERETEAIVQWMAGDENGVVNCLEPHPEIPVLATSGLDEDVKIWVPSCEQEPTLEGLKKTVITNLKNRLSDPARSSDTFEGQMLWILWRHIRRTERHNLESERARSRPGPGGDGQSSGESSTYSEDEEGGLASHGHRLQCSPS